MAERACRGITVSGYEKRLKEKRDIVSVNVLK